MVIIIIITNLAAYDSYARLGLDNSERIVCQIDAFRKTKFLIFFCFSMIVC